MILDVSVTIEKTRPRKKLFLDQMSAGVVGVGRACLRSAVILQRLSLPVHVHTASMSSLEATGEVQRTIHTKLEQQLTPLHLEVINESHMHNVPKGSESHFKVVVVSDKFEGVALIKRHRLIMDALGEQLQQGVHALSIQADTPARWESRGEKITQSPPCLGGSKR